MTFNLASNIQNLQMSWEYFDVEKHKGMLERGCKMHEIMHS